MELYLVAMGAWLVLPPRLWRYGLLDSGWPGPFVAAVLANRPRALSRVPST